MFIPKTLQEENVHSSCLMGLIFSTSWRVTPTKKKFPMGICFRGISFGKLTPEATLG